MSVMAIFRQYPPIGELSSIHRMQQQERPPET